MSPSARAELARRFREYLLEASPKKRERLWRRVAKKAKKLTAAQLEEVLRRAARATKTPPPGFHHGITFLSNGEQWSYSIHVPRGKPPESGWPLVVDPGHTSLASSGEKGIEDVMGTWLDVSGAREEVVLMRTRVLDRLATTERYDAWSSWQRGPGEPGHETIAATLLDAIAHASLRLPVDSNRVVVEGISQCGWWTWVLGALTPDRFAAIVPVSSRTFHVRALVDGLRGTPVYVLHGTADQTCSYAEAKKTVDDLAARGFDIAIHTVEGGPHMGRTFGAWRQLWPKVRGRVRGGPAPAISRLFLTGERPTAGWLQAAGIPEARQHLSRPVARLSAELGGQSVKLSGEGVKEVAIWLSSDQVDLEHPIAVTVNGRALGEKRAALRVRAALDRLRRSGDAGRVASSVLVVPVR